MSKVFGTSAHLMQTREIQRTLPKYRCKFTEKLRASSFPGKRNKTHQQTQENLSISPTKLVLPNVIVMWLAKSQKGASTFR